MKVESNTMVGGIGFGGGGGGFIAPAVDFGGFAAAAPMQRAEVSSGNNTAELEAGLATTMQDMSLGYAMNGDGEAEAKKGNSFASKAV